MEFLNKILYDDIIDDLTDIKNEYFKIEFQLLEYSIN